MRRVLANWLGDWGNTLLRWSWRLGCDIHVAEVTQNDVDGRWAEVHAADREDDR